MTINALIVLIALSALMMRSAGKSVLFIFIIPALLFQIAVTIKIIPDNAFHLIAASLDLAVIFLLVLICKFRILSLALGIASLFSIVANIAGWVAYSSYQNPAAYDGLFVLIYSLVLIISLMEWWSGARADSYYIRFRGSNY
jgi:hypothetical protein